MNSDTAKFIGNIPVHYDGDVCLLPIMPTTSRIALTLTNSRGTAAEAVKQVAAGIPKFAGECGRPASFGIEALIAGRPEAPEPMPGLISYKVVVTGQTASLLWRANRTRIAVGNTHGSPTIGAVASPPFALVWIVDTDEAANHGDS